ncbi:conserved hypothetical protein [Culex quinquefasciatus]|uniref:DNA-dependent protein kinase catalytic subunit n=1 Tax=Culex quinquefasciatus TaxID=7176 RepID=B0WJB1_CULQU|nr:conserved hypothetical protein [Culex quinquefasciatus]|eukprot:XP_001848795.1 conserved hypothetical protein [Culex quinquefasciatus]
MARNGNVELAQVVRQVHVDAVPVLFHSVEGVERRVTLVVEHHEDELGGHDTHRKLGRPVLIDAGSGQRFIQHGTAPTKKREEREYGAKQNLCHYCLTRKTELCGHLLQLATDPDLAICQMFEPLIFQIIHYLTQPSKITQKGTEVLASCLMESISHPSDTGVRDLAARCIREFLLWTIKQTPAGQQPTVSSSSAVNLSVILEQLRTYSMDSNPHRRQGAALAFNNIYRILREEEPQIERSWLDLYYVFSMNYVMTEEFDSSATNLEQISATIDHLVRVLVERNDLFNRPNPSRVVPSAFGGRLLKDLVRWLFGQCSSREESYRHKCMEVFPKLAKAVAGCATERAFIQQYLEDRTILDICDHVNVIQGIAKTPTLQFIVDENLPMIANIYLWLEYFISTLDMYCWLLKGSLLQNPSWFMENSNLFAAIRFFISLVASATMFNLMLLVRPEFVDESQTSVEFRICVDKIIKFNLLKCTITVRIVDLLSWIMHQSYYSSVPENFWEQPQVAAFLIDLIFEPQKMGFDFKSCQDTIAEYPKRIEHLLDRVECFENLQFREMVYEKISDKLTFTYQELSERLERLLKLETIGLEDNNNAKGVLTIAKRYESYQQYFSLETKSSLRTISERILETIFDALKEQRLGEWFQIPLTPSLKRFATVVLKIVFKFMSTQALDPLIDLLLSKVELRLFQQSGSSVLHGEHFVTTFEEAVFEFVLDQFPTSFEKLLQRLDAANFSVIVKLLCSFLEFNYQRKRSDIPVLKTVTEAMLDKWTVILQRAQTLENKFAAVDLQLIELMSCIAMVSPNPLGQIERKATGLQPWLLNLIGNSQITLELKSKAVFLLPTLVGDTDFDSAPVSDALQSLQNQHFPLRSSEFTPNSVERISFENCLVGLLDAMVVSRSPVLLKAIINATAADGEHIAEAKIRSALGDYMKPQNSNQQCYNLKLIFGKFCDESLEPFIRLTVLKRFLISGLRMCSFEALSTFYKSNIKKINDMIRSNYGQFGSGWEAEQALINRFGGYQLIELYVAVLPRDVILSDDCPVAKTLYGEGKTPGNKMITDFTKKAYAARSEVFLTPDSPTAELFRKYQCAAYRTLAAIISNTKDDLQLYNVLLFRENGDKNEFIWRKLINCSENHLYDGFGQELEEYPKIKDKLVSIRRLTAVSASNSKRFKYIQMTSVFESSLSQDVTKLDLNYSVVRTTQEASTVQADEFSQQLARKTTIALERSKVNDHEVMATICAVIQHMHENKITPTPEGDRVVPPPWIKFLAASLRDQQQHKNVRLFLAKVIDNCRTWLKPYAATLIPPLMQVIVDECITTQLNTFVTDLYALILEWSDAFQPSSCDEISLASGLVRFLMRNCFHARREVFRLNLELAKNLIERWKAVVSVPVQLLYDMIGPTQDPESAQNLCGLQLNAIVMANGLVPWTETSKFDFVRAIFRCLDSEKVAVYRPASELLGMCLGHLYPAGEEKEDERYQNEFLAKLVAMRKRLEKKFMDVVYGIHKAFPAIVDSFLAIITHAIPTASGASKKILLEMLLSRVEVYKEQVHRELISLDLKGMLKDRSYQLLALHLINKSLALMSAENLEDVIDSVILLTSNDQSDVRDVIYEIMIFIYENSQASLSDAAKQKLRKALLTGLTDADQTLQNHIFDFWTDQSRFPQDIDARFQRILEDLYEPSQEMNFLGYATHILLDTAVRNPESKRRIFQHEYEADVKLKEYTIDTHWRQRNSFASAPLFVESQQRFLLAGDGSQMERRIRATQFSNEANMFEPTQDPTTMTQSAASFTLPTQNSLLFEINPPMLDRRSKRVVAAASSGASPKSYDSLRRRILKDKERSSRDQALRAIERHSYEAVRKVESHKMKQGEVVLYRRYRIGDFPDLLINSLALLLPLQALCRRDPPLARQVFVEVFSGILDEWDQTERDSGEAIDAINQAIQKIFGETKSCDPNLFGALIEVVMSRPKQFDLKADSVATVASGANMMNMGVLYLENKLHEYDFPDQSIVSRSSSVTMEAIHWIKLAELYHGLSEYDVLGDIFSHKMDSDTRLKEAIELESKGFFYKARELYHRMLLENQSRIAENNFCFQSYYNCFEQMGMWEDLVPILEQQLDGSAEEFWTDEWNMENMLPKYVHANTRLNLSGDERGRGFITLLDAWMRVPDRKDHLKTNFGEEISMLQLASGEYAKAKLYSDQVLLQFLEEWSYLDVLSDKLRIRKLLDIRKVSEVHTLGVLLGDSLQEKRIKKLVASWENSHPTASDSPVIWDTLLAYRKFALNKLETQLEASTDDRLLGTNFVSQLTDALFATELRLLDASFEQNNLRFARKVIKRLDMVADEQSERGFRWRIAQNKWRRISELESGNVQRMVANFKRIKGVVDDEGLQRYRAVRVEGLHELFRAGEDLREVLAGAVEVNTDELKRLLEYEGSDLDTALGSFSLDCLQKSVEIANTGLLDISDDHAHETSLLADCHYRLAQFCYDVLEKQPLGETLNHERHLITSLLASMQFGSKPARQLFPVLLQLPNLQDGSLHRCFIDASGLVPEWMFLRWIPQLLSYVDFYQDSFLESILLRLAASYPMALYYPAKFAHGECTKRFPERTMGSFACRLMRLLEFPRLDRFVQELSQVVVPCMKVSNMASDLARKLSAGSNLTGEQYRTTVLESMKEAFPESVRGIGREHEKVISFKSEWKKLLNFDPERQIADIWKFIEHIRMEMEKLVPRHSTLELRRYSPWLAEYHFNDREEMLELPGQYNVDHKPNVVNHIKIVKVHNQLEMFKTLRKPLRVQINGSDGKSYDFLVKYGEDLRQDQRIQQLLGTISNQMSLDQHCKEHQLSVRTYEVVPIRSNFGILGWIPNTSSIKSIAVRSMVRFNTAGDVTDTINREYNQFLLQTSGSTPERRPGLTLLYGKTASACTPEKT